MGRPDPHVDRAVVAPGEPWLRAVCGHVAHVRAAAAGDLQLRHRGARVGVEHADAALVAVGDVELGGVAGEVEAVGAHPGRDLPLDLPGGAVEYPDAVLVAVGDVEDGPVGCELDVLRAGPGVAVGHVDHA